MIKKTPLALAAISLFALNAAAQAAPTGSWSCTAPGLASASYDGGSMAYVHLASYPDGGTYAVTKSGNKATGTTKNGTRFTCVQR